MSQPSNNCQENSGGPVSGQIRAARKAKGLTQAQLARAAGCCQTTISDIERGYYPAANQRWIAAVAATLQLPASDHPHAG